MRKILLSAALLTAGVAHAQTTSYTLADVAKHATAADCWMVLNATKVYNFTPFVTMHPGGSTMVPYCGKNGDPGFKSVSHSSNAVALETTYLIGALVAAPAPIGVTITPTNATIKIGGTEQFTPAVVGSTAGVAWTLSPASLGTISASGLFTGVVAGQGTVTAASTQDATKSASALITVSAATTPPPPAAIVVSVNPSALSLTAGATHQFSAALTNSTLGVTWTATAAIGKISATGAFTAAMVPASGKVTATSVQDPTKSDSVQVTLTAVTPVPVPPPVNCPPPRHHGDDGHDGHDD
jgi:Cytochrome b5-like Heme/Steroid binding domain/Bacterial Ig-like domain (group 2)